MKIQSPTNTTKPNTSTYRNTDTYIAKVSIATLIVPIILFFFGIGFLIPSCYKTIIGYFTTQIQFNTKRISGKTGIVKKVSMQSPLMAVQNFEVKQGFIGQIFNFGTVIITTSSGTYKFDSIENPEHTREVYFDLCEKMKDEDRIKAAQQNAEAMSHVTLNVKSL